jgi:hypothetical protein
MEVRDGFIVGIFNYCDRWCETCAFTSRCRLFADTVQIEAALDPGMTALVHAPPLPEELTPPLSSWTREMIDGMNDASLCAVAVADVPTPPPVPATHLAIEARADDYFTRAHAWLHGRTYPPSDGSDPCAVIGWFHLQIVVKIHRAIRSLAAERGRQDWPPDSDGSAKVALLGIDRSHAAWLDAIARGLATDSEASAVIADLVWLGDALERVFPRARAFVRPGLDEPDQMSTLLAREARPRERLRLD